jgi:hypothetical protein
MSRIDEKSRRKPGFTAGVAVVLADGQEWSFPPPRLRLRPVRSGDGFAVTVNRVGLPDYPRWEAVLCSEAPVPPEEYWSVRMTAAVALLLANYELTDQELGSLLVWETGDPAADERWDRIDEAILGAVPKPGPAT